MEAINANKPNNSSAEAAAAMAKLGPLDSVEVAKCVTIAVDMIFVTHASVVVINRTIEERSMNLSRTAIASGSRQVVQTEERIVKSCCSGRSVLDLGFGRWTVRMTSWSFCKLVRGSGEAEWHRR
jgi:hypothetical protein